MFLAGAEAAPFWFLGTAAPPRGSRALFFFLSLTSLAPASVAATLGLTTDLFFLISSRETPTIALWTLATFLVLLKWDDQSGDATILNKANDNVLPLLLNTVVLALLVQASPGLGPHQLRGFLSLVNHALRLGAAHGDDLHARQHIRHN